MTIEANEEPSKLPKARRIKPYVWVCACSRETELLLLGVRKGSQKNYGFIVPGVESSWSGPVLYGTTPTDQALPGFASRILVMNLVLHDKTSHTNDTEEHDNNHHHNSSSIHNGQINHNHRTHNSYYFHTNQNNRVGAGSQFQTPSRPPARRRFCSGLSAGTPSFSASSSFSAQPLRPERTLNGLGFRLRVLVVACQLAEKACWDAGLFTPPSESMRTQTFPGHKGERILRPWPVHIV